jgi:DNA repair exonuclease SbcCD nuclease subunit
MERRIILKESDVYIPDIGDADIVSVFVIGDPHFKFNTPVTFSMEVIEKCVNAAREADPTFIVILGDTLHTNEVVKVPTHKLACLFVEQLSEIAHTYMLIGNHDLTGPTQFCTDNHIFNPLKKWNNVTIVDYPTKAEYGDFTFGFCPYTPKGRFIEALHLLDNWENCRCIFGHQGIEGWTDESHPAKDGKGESGDVWNENYPVLISGHIHKPQKIGKNVYYPGSLIQVDDNEEPDKRVWKVTFDPNQEEPEITEIDLGIKCKKVVRAPLATVLSSYQDYIDAMENYYVILKVECTIEEYHKIFRKNNIYKKLIKAGVKVVSDPIQDQILSHYSEEVMNVATSDKSSFESVLDVIVQTKSDAVKRAYQKFKGDDMTASEETIIYELNFVEE